MNKQQLTLQDYKDAAKLLNVDYKMILAIAKKEDKRGSGFNDDGMPIILFERHKFFQKTDGKYYAENPDICNPKPGGYGKYSEQHPKLDRAVKLNKKAALESASWGRFQIMGENWKDLSYKDIQQFVNAMYESELKHLEAFVRFIKFKKIDVYMRAKNFQKIAELYNGKNYKINRYDTELEKIYNNL